MIKEKETPEKKDWSTPVLFELDFKKTAGGATFDTGEDGYIDPVSG